MALEPWYKVVLPRREVREGRSFNPDEFAIALEQVVAGTAPPDYRDPDAFFDRTCFTRALRDHTGMVLRRLAGETANTAPVLTLVTQFGGGKTHTLTALYHLVTASDRLADREEVRSLLHEAALAVAPAARVAVSSATPGTRAPEARPRGSMSHASLPVNEASTCWERRLQRRRRGPRPSAGCSRQRTRRCWCCSTRCSTSSTAIVRWPTRSTRSSRT